MKGFEYFKESNKDILFVKGLRRKRKVGDEFFTICMSIIASIFLKKYLWDINAQPNLFPKSFFNSWKNPPADFSLDLYVLNNAKKQKFNIVRFPVVFKDPIFGSSKWNKNFFSKIKFIKRNFVYTFKLAFQN